MRHRVAGKKLGRTSAHKKAMFRNMVTSLILHDRIETTLPKAKELRRWADKMITLAKKNSIHARRQAASILMNKGATQKLFATLVDRYKERAGGYTRVLKLGHRHGDSAPMAIIEYLTAEYRGNKAAEKAATDATGAVGKKAKMAKKAKKAAKKEIVKETKPEKRATKKKQTAKKK